MNLFLIVFFIDFALQNQFNCKHIIFFMNSLHPYESYKNTNNAQIKVIKKLKKTRFSEPNFFLNNPTEENNIQNQIIDKKETKQIRIPRFSQIPTQPLIYDGYRSPQHQVKLWNSPQTFFSPSYINRAHLSAKHLQQLKNHQKTNLINTGLLEQNVNPQTKTRKMIESHKQTLNKIQQILINHGVLKKSASNERLQKEKSFRKNKRNQKEHEYQYQQPGLQQIKQLKQTVSTSPSLKPSRHPKIGDFILGKQLGKGKFGKVKIALHKKTGLVYSLKIVKKSTIQKQQFVNQFINEVKIQSLLNHPNIVKLYCVFDDKENIYLLEQLCCQGNLYEKIKRFKKLSENQVKSIIHSICDGVSQIHKNHIMHRDIKPQNIVLCFEIVKIIDFGWSATYKDVMRQTFCGTPLYISPQLLSGNTYSQKVDLWSIGILTYQLLVGRIPFQIRSERELSKIVNCKIQYPPELSSDAKSFLQCLLVKDPKNRKNITQILQHPFLQKKI